MQAGCETQGYPAMLLSDWMEKELTIFRVGNGPSHLFSFVSVQQNAA
jgi:hypothetical protein